MEIKKIFKETIEESLLIGKRYTEADRVNGSFGKYWGEFFKNGLFEQLEKGGGRTDFDYLGVCRINNGEFEYWIGMLFAPDAAVPEGFDSVIMPKCDYAVSWLYGSESNGELFGLNAHNQCLKLLKEHGFIRKEDDWCIERYNCPRYIDRDEKGNVILDYYIAVE